MDAVYLNRADVAKGDPDMPIAPTYPGVYVEELDSGVRTIVGVPTSIAAFVGWAPRGPDYPVQITGFGDYQAKFGGLHPKSPMSYAVYQFYQNGGSEAIIMRLVGGSTGTGDAKVDPAPAKITLPGSGADPLVLAALSDGVWGNGLRARVDSNTRPPEDGEELYNLSIFDPTTGIESYPNVSTDPDSPRSLENVLSSSQLVKVDSNPEDSTTHHEVLPKPQKDVPAGQNPFLGDPSKEWYVQASGGADGNPDAEVGGLPRRRELHLREGQEGPVRTAADRHLQHLVPTRGGGPGRRADRGPQSVRRSAGDADG